MNDIQIGKRLNISAFRRRKPGASVSWQLPPFQKLRGKWLLLFSQNADGFF